jgi:hypothetical protein
MKCFTVTESKVHPYISVSPNPYRHIGVGEQGRGRTYGMVAVGLQDFPAEEALTNATVILTKARQTLVLVKEAPRDTSRALVVLKVSAGYRGSTTFSGVVFDKTPCPKRGAREYLFDYSQSCPKCGAAIVENVHPDAGVAYEWPAFPPEGVKVLVKGWKAQGGAGRMGGHEESILIMDPGSMIRVCRGGRLYGAPPKVYLAWTGEEMIHGDHAYLMHKLGITDDVQEGELM